MARPTPSWSVPEPTPPPEPAPAQPPPSTPQARPAATAAKATDAVQASAAEVVDTLEQRTRQAVRVGLETYDSLPPIEHWPGALYRTVVLAPISWVWNSIFAFVHSPRTHRYVLRLSVVTILYYVALFFALLAYIGFVSVWFPHAGSTKAIWLQYGYVLHRYQSTHGGLVTDFKARWTPQLAKRAHRTQTCTLYPMLQMASCIRTIVRKYPTLPSHSFWTIKRTT